MNPKISVIIPVYRVEAYLRRCVDSVLSQDFDGLEVILVAQPGGDKCVEICREYALRDSRVRVVEKEAEGLSSARNAGLDIAKGEYVSFIDSDDYILPGMFARLYSFCEENLLQIGMCGAYRDSGDGRLGEYWAQCGEKILTYPANPRRDFFLSWNIIGRNATAWGKLYRRELVKDLRFVDIFSEDSIFNCTCFGQAGSAGSVRDAFYVYNNRPGSLVYVNTEAKLERHVRDYWKLLTDTLGSDNQRGDILAYSAVRLMAGCIYSKKLSGQETREICEYILGLIGRMDFAAHINRAQNPELFAVFAEISGMEKTEAENYYKFIESLNSGLDAMIAWQDRWKNEFRQVR